MSICSVGEATDVWWFSSTNEGIMPPWWIPAYMSVKTMLKRIHDVCKRVNLMLVELHEVWEEILIIARRTPLASFRPHSFGLHTKKSSHIFACLIFSATNRIEGKISGTRKRNSWWGARDKKNSPLPTHPAHASISLLTPLFCLSLSPGFLPIKRKKSINEGDTGNMRGKKESSVLPLQSRFLYL